MLEIKRLDRYRQATKWICDGVNVCASSSSDAFCWAEAAADLQVVDVVVATVVANRGEEKENTFVES